MDDFMSSLLEQNLPYLSLMLGITVSLMLYVVMFYQVQKLRCALVFYRQRVQGLESRLLAAPGGNPVAERTERPGGPGAEAPTAEAAQHRVLHLHGLGYSKEEIARETGIREPEVDFVLKVSEHLETAGGALALRKIS